MKRHQRENKIPAAISQGRRVQGRLSLMSPEFPGCNIRFEMGQVWGNGTDEQNCSGAF
jgi:hypothetical protein